MTLQLKLNTMNMRIKISQINSLLPFLRTLFRSYLDRTNNSWNLSSRYPTIAPTSKHFLLFLSINTSCSIVVGILTP
jgi:hypothetical protein